MTNKIEVGYTGKYTKEKVICKCGNDKWILHDSIVQACYPPIHVDTYKCTKCGEPHKESHQGVIRDNIETRLYK